MRAATKRLLWPTVEGNYNRDSRRRRFGAAFVPTIPEALMIAEQALQGGDYSRAQYVYQQILQALPEEPGALNGLGVLAYRAGQLEAAERYVRRAIGGFSGNPAFHNNLNLICRRQGRLDEAIACCQRALELDPNSPELHNNLGIALKERGDLERAVASFERALDQKPAYADAHYNLANTLVKLHRLDQAERAYRRAIQLAPLDCEAHNNLGTLLQLQGRLDEAMACYHTAVGARAESAEAHRNRALLRLLLGDFAEGWPEYEWRWRMPGVKLPSAQQPRWEGQPLAGKTVLLVAEQGIGDTIQFIRYAALVKGAGARVAVDCPPTLHALFRQTPGIDRLVAGDAGAEAADYQIPLLSLPVVVGTNLDTIPAAIPYVFAEPERVAHWRQELADRPGFKVGIAWQGNPDFTADYYRSIPLTAFAPLAACPNVELFSLQKGHGCEQLAAVADRFKIVDLGKSLDDEGSAFVDTAGVMMNLDLVIACDTATAHLAGALGVNVWVALQRTANWRWLAARSDSPWYPTARLFRQSQLGDWTDVVEQMAIELRRISCRHT
jgi:Flp pilus assembly protein TadD